MNNLFLLIWQFLADLLIPDSLSSNKSHTRYSNKEHFDLVSPRTAVIRPGDLIIVRTPGAFYKLFRGLAGQRFDHLAIVMEDGLFLHVGPPIIRLLPVQLLLLPHRNPTVLRPQLTADELSELLTSLKGLIGQKYDYIRVYSFIARLAISKYIGLQQPFKQIKSLNGKLELDSGININTATSESILYNNPYSNDTTTNNNNTANSSNNNSFICTDAILNRLIAVSKEFKSAAHSVNTLDYSRIQSWSMNDIYRLASKKPKLFNIIPLPQLTTAAAANKFNNNNTPITNSNNNNPIQLLYSKLNHLSMNIYYQLTPKIQLLIQLFSLIQSNLPAEIRQTILSTIIYIVISYLFKLYKYKLTSKTIILLTTIKTIAANKSKIINQLSNNNHHQLLTSKL